MTHCTHKHLTLIKPSSAKLRCKHCHLVLEPHERKNGYCPECLEARAKKHKDFEPVIPQTDHVKYRCENCGIIIECR